jgi:hypothetical protein
MSNSKSPSFNFFSADVLVGVSDLTMAERGQYITLLCLQHQKGHLSRKTMEIAVGAVSDDVLGKFKVDEDGNYYNSRLDKEVNKKNAFVESRLKNLSNNKGNKPHTDNHMDNHMGNHTESHMEIEIEIENINDNENNNDIDNNLYFQELFDKLWSRYPKKVKKQVALGSFMKIRPSNDLFNQMMTSLEQHRRWKGWSDPKYIPYASTWLNQKRWEDELPESEMISYDAGDWWEDIEQRAHEFDDAINHAIKVVRQ